MDVVVLVVKLIKCVLQMLNDYICFCKPVIRVLKTIFNFLLNSFRVECDIKILASSANNIGTPICSTLLGKSFLYI